MHAPRPDLVSTGLRAHRAIRVVVEPLGFARARAFDALRPIQTIDAAPIFAPIASHKGG